MENLEDVKISKRTIILAKISEEDAKDDFEACRQLGTNLEMFEVRTSLPVRVSMVLLPIRVKTRRKAFIFCRRFGTRPGAFSGTT